MKTVKFGNSDLMVPVIGLGCMRMNNLEKNAIPYYIEHCCDLGINFFDHADVYSDGECESLFGEAMKSVSVPRDKMIIQSKCGIIRGVMYDFSYEHIIKSVDGILNRLGTDYLDILLLHRPDALCEPEEVAKAFDELESKGKVRHFGVSNHRPSQIELLKTCVRQEIHCNQMRFSIPYSSLVSTGIEANMITEGGADRNGDLLDYCRLHGITVQAWAPFRGKNGSFVDSNETYPDLNWALGEISAKYNTTKTAIAAAWILRHPARIQTIAGTMNFDRIKEVAAASDITLTRDEWYRLYTSAGHLLP